MGTSHDEVIGPILRRSSGPALAPLRISVPHEMVSGINRATIMLLGTNGDMTYFWDQKLDDDDIDGYR